MEDALQLPVAFRGEELEFPFRIAQSGYTRKFLVCVDGVDVHFEMDDSGELRALIPGINELTVPLPSKELLLAIGASISSLTDT